MKKSAICITLATLALAGCNNDEKNAQARLDNARSMYEQNEFFAAKNEIDSIRILYPKEFKVIREGLTLMRQVEQKEAERNLAFCDSLIPVKQQELEGLKKGFNFEKDSAYNEIGNYVSKQQTIERNIQRCYIRSGVNEKGEMYLASVYFGGKPINHTGIKLSIQDGLFAETPAIPYDGGLNYHFKDLGNTTEVVTYQGEKCEDAVKFIFANKEKRIKVEYTGGKPYILYIADADKKAIASTYELAVVLSDIEKLTKEKEKATKKLAYLENQKELNENGKPYVGVVNGFAVMQTTPSAAFEVQTASAPTANEEMNVSEIKVISNDGQVIVTNASGKMITLSNILGQTIGVRRANSEYFSMPATSGIVLVTVEGDATYKVIVK